MSTYYVPKSRTFQSIDSFGVDGPSKTIYFFQMKSADVKTVKGDKVEEYWTTASELEIERCVLVYVVPAGERWERAKKKKSCEEVMGFPERAMPSRGPVVYALWSCRLRLTAV